MGKITPTFMDTVAAPRAGNGSVHIMSAHEPVRDAADFTPFAPTVQIPVNLPFAPDQVPQTAAAPPLKVALIGTAPSSRMLAPFNDPSWTIWGCSPGNMNQLPRVDAWFEIHGNLLWPEHVSYGPAYIEWLKAQKFPIYMQDQSLVPGAIPLPKDELVAEFGPYCFTSSFSWMTALAMMKGAVEIALYGIDMASRNEYILQRQGYQHFFVEAKRRNIKLWAPHESDIMQPPGLYAYSDVTPFGRKVLARKKEIEDRLAPMIAQRDQLNHQITYLQGAAEDVDYFASVWLGAQT